MRRAFGVVGEFIALIFAHDEFISGQFNHYRKILTITKFPTWERRRPADKL